MILEWIATHGSPVDAVIMFMGFCVVWLIRYIVNSQKAQNVRLWKEITSLKYQLNQVDKLTYTLSILHKRDGLDLIKESANSQGDYGLNRDVE
jgi:hypothetical protein